MNAIILCGGLGTRLGSLTIDTPKPLIEVAGKPFVGHVLDKLRAGGVSQVCLAVSFQWQKLEATLGSSWNGIPLSYSVEDQPLGTGGAVRRALVNMGWSESFVVNGDTLIDVDMHSLEKLAFRSDADMVVTLKNIEDTCRFGRVNLQPNGRISSFEEKGQPGPGLINAGLYWLSTNALRHVPGEKFGLERDVMVAHVADLSIYGLVTQGYFIDMGIPEDLARARVELSGGPR
jgi:D-glycero-alpha-D-manno-heptose 1-phosphate guanylyltransferase